MGIGKAFLRLHIGALLFVAGYSFSNYIHNDKRYSVIRKNDLPYLIDKVRKEQAPISEEAFQVGSLEYRLNGLLNEPSLSEALRAIKHQR